MTPPIKPIGKNTATAVKVAAVTVKPISLVAIRAASRGVFPFSICRMMFSTSTMASSTIEPITKANANRVMVSKLKPYIAMTINVPNKDMGMANAEIRVACQFHKKGKMTTTERMIASIRASMVEWVALRIYSPCVAAKVKVTSFKLDLSCCTSFSTPLTTSRVLASPFLIT